MKRYGGLTSYDALRLDLGEWSHAVDDRELKRRIFTLTPNRRTVISRRYGLYGRPQTLEWIGAYLGVTRERVRQIQLAGLRDLRMGEKE